MSQIDTEIQQEQSAEDSASEATRMVPVAQSIHYRKRAQSAERKAEELTEQLDKASTEVERLSGRLNQIRTEQEISRKLAAAGVLDLETALLVAKTKVNDNGDTDLDELVEQLKKEKQYLFEARDNDGRATTARRTAAAKDRLTSGNATIERAAKRAAASGSRTDLQEYLKLRRNFV